MLQNAKSEEPWFDSRLTLRDDSEREDPSAGGEGIESSMSGEVSLGSDVWHRTLLTPLAFSDSL